MNIHEYQAKEIFKEFNIPIVDGRVILNEEDIDSVIDNFDSEVFVVKAQIHAGGRGKGGGVKLSNNKEEAKSIAHKMWGMILKTPQTGEDGQKVQRLYIESGAKIDKEFYLSAAIDRENKCITFISSNEGGVDIEEVAHQSAEKIFKVKVDPSTGIQAFHGRKIAFQLGLSDTAVAQVCKVVNSIYKICTELDASQVEINPLVLTKDKQILALDAKINFDDNALIRQPKVLSLRDKTEEDPLELKAADNNLSYVKMDGNIGCMVNGAGLAMATMDIIKLYGSSPANFLDVGGGADQKRVSEALRIILSDKNVKGILVNIFGGIMRCDIIAEGIVAAVMDVGLNIPLVVRLSGTNFELGKDILNKSGLKIIAADNLADAAKKIVQAVNG